MDPASVAKRIHVPTYQEILARVKSRYPHNVGTYERERRSLELVRNVIIDRTAPVLRLRDLVRSLHPFYRELVGISSPASRRPEASPRGCGSGTVIS